MRNLGLWWPISFSAEKKSEEGLILCQRLHVWLRWFSIFNFQFSVKFMKSPLQSRPYVSSTSAWVSSIGYKIIWNSVNPHGADLLPSLKNIKQHHQYGRPSAKTSFTSTMKIVHRVSIFSIHWDYTKHYFFLITHLTLNLTDIGLNSALLWLLLDLTRYLYNHWRRITKLDENN